MWPMRAAILSLCTLLPLAAAAAPAPRSRVIVALRDAPGNPAARMSCAAAVIARAGAEQLDVYALWSMIPGFAAEVTESGLERLRRDPDVAAVDPDVGGSGQLAQSVPLIHGDVARKLGFTGVGVTVAVLDSGIRATHPDLKDALVDEACFCRNANGTGCCPNGNTTQTGAGAANDDHGHGTNISGIIASRGIVSSFGVAPGCSIVAVKVLDANNRFSGTSQVLSALDYVLTTHPEVRVVNMSLGTSALFTGTCDDATAFTMSFAAAIHSLVTNGTAVFASSGNDLAISQMTAPACVHDTIAVGAVYDSNFGTNTVFCNDSTAADKITCFSNVSTALDLLAPGAAITSDGNSGGLSTFFGSSQASAHASGAAAVLMAARPALRPDQIESVLKASGVPLFDARIGLTFPRIDVEAALESILAAERPRRRAAGSAAGPPARPSITPAKTPSP